MDTPSGSRGTVLVVDDDAQVRALAARALADEGFDVLQAPDAESALELLHDPLSANLCLVVTDIVMPGMGGDQLGRVLHDLRPTLPVLYMSGYSRPNLDFLPPTDLQHCWIEKPFSIQALVERARALCTPTPTAF
ncbi:MAG TPA: response regulator [Gemmatimonadales bacterium]|nr:response regulator [Gemmatimonadales bacterium]